MEINLKFLLYRERSTSNTFFKHSLLLKITNVMGLTSYLMSFICDFLGPSKTTTNKEGKKNTNDYTKQLSKSYIKMLRKILFSKNLK